MRLARSLVLLLVLVLLPSLAAAAGVAIRWDQCYGDAGVQNKNFACDTNDGSESLVGSFVLPSDLADVVGVELVVDVGFAGAVLPAWWQFRNAGSCRQTSLTMLLGNGTYCPEWSVGNAAGGIGAYSASFPRGQNFARIVMATAVALEFRQSLSGLSEYVAFQLAINHAKTVGTGACGGCTTPACIVFHSCHVVQPSPLFGVNLVELPSNGTDSHFATWQGGGGVVIGGQSGCPAATPTAKRTWGAVKSMYR